MSGLPSTLKLAACSLLLATCCAVAITQTAAPPPAGTSTNTPWAYEVVSVKPYKAGSDPGVSMWWRSTRDGFSAKGVTLQQLLITAYGILTPDQIDGLPSWGDSDQFAVEAKMDEDTTAAFQKLTQKERVHAQQQMMQAMLADRFGLKVHHETKEKAVYNLVIARSAFKLKETAAGAPGGYSMGNGQFTGKGIAIDTLAFSLSNELGRLVVDKTGLAGKYDMALKWTPDDQQGMADAGPSIFTAIEEQLGLKLESAKGPVDTIVIDHTDKPSED